MRKPIQIFRPCDYPLAVNKRMDDAGLLRTEKHFDGKQFYWIAFFRDGKRIDSRKGGLVDFYKKCYNE